MKSTIKTKTFNLLKATSLSFIIGSTLFVATTPAQAGAGSQAARQIVKFVVRQAPRRFRNRQQTQPNYTQPSRTHNGR